MRDLDASGDPRLRIGSLFSGYGGLDLAVEHVFNAKTVWFSELNEPVAHVFWHHWPEVPNLGDITAIDWSRVCQRRGGFQSSAQHLFDPGSCVVVISSCEEGPRASPAVGQAQKVHGAPRTGVEHRGGGPRSRRLADG